MSVGWPPRPVGLAFGNEAQWIAAAGILGQAVVREPRHPGIVERHVLEHGSEAGRRREDLRLGVRIEADDLGVAAALEVEDALGPPAMLVVADQRAAGIG